MKKAILLAAVLPLALGNKGSCSEDTDPAAARQAQATRTAMNAADREVGMPRIKNFAQRKLLKNAYEDMDQTTLVYVYVQSLDGRFIGLGQAVGYGVSLGTQLTAGQYPQRVNIPWASGDKSATSEIYLIDQPEPNGLYQPTSGAATIVNLVDGKGVAHTALVEPNVVTTPSKLPASAVNVPCPGDVDPTKVKDAKETGAVVQRD